MKSLATEHILILSNTGLLGRIMTVYATQALSNSVTSTSRTDKHQLNTLFYDPTISHQPVITFLTHNPNSIIINCIGQGRVSDSAQDYTLLNSELPHQLEQFCAQYDATLIHISSDAVFPVDAGPVDESSSLDPEGEYGHSKLAGEVTSSHAITIRTSLLGFDPFHGRGILELVRNNSSLTGFTQALWSGCTALQLSRWILDVLIIRNKLPEALALNTPIHFAPIGPVSKLDILTTAAAVLQLNPSITSAVTPVISRYLISKFNTQLNIPKNIPLAQALQDAVNFEKKLR